MSGPLIKIKTQSTKKEGIFLQKPSVLPSACCWGFIRFYSWAYGWIRSGHIVQSNECSCWQFQIPLGKLRQIWQVLWRRLPATVRLAKLQNQECYKLQIEPNIKLFAWIQLDHEIASTWRSIVDLHVLAISWSNTVCAKRFMLGIICILSSI